MVSQQLFPLPTPLPLPCRTCASAAPGAPSSSPARPPSSRGLWPRSSCSWTGIEPCVAPTGTAVTSPLAHPTEVLVKDQCQPLLSKAPGAQARFSLLILNWEIFHLEWVLRGSHYSLHHQVEGTHPSWRWWDTPSISVLRSTRKDQSTKPQPVPALTPSSAFPVNFLHKVFFSLFKGKLT